MKVLVIGAAGMIGRKLVARITREGAIGGRAVTALTLADVIRPTAPAGFGGKVETHASDLSVPGTAEALIAPRPDVVFHLAAVVSGEAEADFEKGYRVNLDGGRALFEAIRREGAREAYCPRVVFCSSLAVFGRPFPKAPRLHGRDRDPPAHDLHPPGQAQRGCLRLLLQHPARAADRRGRGAAGGRPRAPLVREPDERIIRIVDGWAEAYAPDLALSLGFTAEKTFAEIIRAHIEDELGGSI